MMTSVSDYARMENRMTSTDWTETDWLAKRQGRQLRFEAASPMSIEDLGLPAGEAVALSPTTQTGSATPELAAPSR